MEHYKQTFIVKDIKAGETIQIGRYDGQLDYMSVSPDMRNDNVMVYGTDAGKVYAKAKEKDFRASDLSAVTVEYWR